MFLVGFLLGLCLRPPRKQPFYIFLASKTLVVVVVVVVDAVVVNVAVVLWSFCIVLAVYFVLLPAGSYF